MGERCLKRKRTLQERSTRCQDDSHNGSICSLQPMVTETLMKEKENNQCGLEEVEPNGNWKVMTIVIVVINIIGFAAMTFAMF